jgi:peptidoglycan/xylan/chitin deacetylase (PgdA/CDA1 family)
MIAQRTKQRVEALLARWAPVRRCRAVVLCYHSIHDSLPFASATPALFDQHLQWLRANCMLVPLHSLRCALRQSTGERPIVAVTFDDGYQDNYTHAFPRLQEAGVTATFFLATGLVEAEPTVTWRLSRLHEADPATVTGLVWPQIREMRAAGMEFGAHTHTHPSLASLDGVGAPAEVQRSREILEHQLGENVSMFAYPFGKPRLHFTAATMAAVETLGFSLAVAIHYRGVRDADSPFALPRFSVTGDSVELLAAKVYGRLDALGVWQQAAPMSLAR